MYCGFLKRNISISVGGLEREAGYARCKGDREMYLAFLTRFRERGRFGVYSVGS